MTSLRREVKNVRTYMFTGVTVHVTPILSVLFYVRYFVGILYFYFRYKTNKSLRNFKIYIIDKIVRYWVIHNFFKPLSNKIWKILIIIDILI